MDLDIRDAALKSSNKCMNSRKAVVIRDVLGKWFEQVENAVEYVQIYFQSGDWPSILIVYIADIWKFSKPIFY